MLVDKSKVLELLRSKGEDENAERADRELPQQVDTELHAIQLDKLGLNPHNIVTELGPGGGLGGMPGR